MTTYIKNEPELEMGDFFEEKQVASAPETPTMPREPQSSDDHDNFPSYDGDEPPVEEGEQDDDTGVVEEGEIAEVIVPLREDPSSASSDILEPPAPATKENNNSQSDAAGEQNQDENILDPDTINPSPKSSRGEGLTVAVLASPAGGTGTGGEEQEAETPSWLSLEHGEDDPSTEEPRQVLTNLDGKGDFPHNKYHTSKLHSLIYENNWEEATQRLLQYKYVCPKEENNTNLPQVSEIGFVDDMGRLPLHCALQFAGDAPWELISKLLGKDGYNFAEVRHRVSKDLPLHMVCSVAPKDGLKIMRVLEAYPVAVLAESGDGNSTPLCLLLEHQPDLQVVSMLLEQAEKHKLQLDASILLAADSEGQIPLHIAIQHYALMDVILYLMEKCTKSIYAKRKDGLLPLHVAAQHGCTKEVLSYLLQEYVAGVEMKANKSGSENTPLHLLFHPQDNIDQWLGVHDENVPCDLLQPYEMAKMMLDAYYKHFVDTFGQAQGRKRKKNSGPETMALNKVKQLLKKKNTSGWAVMGNAEACLAVLGNSSEDLEAIVNDMHQIVKGKNIFEREDA